jgi:hypothetical protein
MATVNDHGGGIDLGGSITCVLENLPARDANPVVVRADVDQIRGMHIDGDTGAAELFCVVALIWLLPRLRVGEEDLDEIGLPLFRLDERVL